MKLPSRNLVVLRGGGRVEVEPAVIGGMVLDIHAIPSMPANPRTTTPGQVHYMLGGVARNIAECMSKLGTKPFMISVVGLDVAGIFLSEHLKSAGLSIRGEKTLILLSYATSLIWMVNSHLLLQVFRQLRNFSTLSGL